MHLVLSILWAGLFLSSVIPLNKANPSLRSDTNNGKSGRTGVGVDATFFKKGDGMGEDILEEPDFDDDDDSDELMNIIDSDEPNINSLMHLHEDGGEILVPCFGMWWPVGGGGGGGGGYYDYGGDYYGDYRKKRRRSRKQRKAAKMKRKKS